MLRESKIEARKLLLCWGLEQPQHSHFGYNEKPQEWQHV